MSFKKLLIVNFLIGTFGSLFSMPLFFLISMIFDLSPKIGIGVQDVFMAFVFSGLNGVYFSTITIFAYPVYKKYISKIK